MIEVDMASETSWSAPGGVVVEEREQGGRRIVRLAGKRDSPARHHLLPEANRYRLRFSDLRPAPMPVLRYVDMAALEPGSSAAPSGSAVEDVITVTAESPLLDRPRISTGATLSAEELAKIPTARDTFQELKQGLVGGVKPLPLAIPESGKALHLAGILPPTRVALVLDVKAKRP